MTRAETKAITDAIEAIPILAAKTFVSAARYVDGRANPDQVARPYVVVHPGGGPDNQERLTGTYSDRRPSFTIHVVGDTPQQVEDVMSQVDVELRANGRGVIPSVIGRRTGRVMRDSLQAIEKDADSTPPLFWQPAEYAFKSSPPAPPAS